MKTRDARWSHWSTDRTGSFGHSGSPESEGETDSVMTSSMQSHDWRQQEWVQGRKQMEFRPPQPQQHVPGTVHDVLASAQKGAFSRVDLETLKISARQLDLK